MMHMVCKNNLKVYLLFAFLLTIGLLTACSGSDKNAEKQAETPKAKAQKENVTETPKKVEKTDNKEWDALLEAARKEGTVVFAGPPIKEIRDGLKLFENKYGIKVDFLAASGSKIYARLMPEFKAGKFTVDVQMGGVKTVARQMLPAGMLEPIEPYIIRSDVGCGNWTTDDGCPEFVDPAKAGQPRSIVRLGTTVLGNVIFVNTTKIDPSSIKSYADLLDPKYKGRIASENPGSNGPGAQVVNYLLVKFGKEFVEKLYKGQKVAYSDDNRQIADWIGHGAYDVVVGADKQSMVNLMEEGLPIKEVYLKDSPGYLSGGWLGALTRMKEAPHPNAATVFINWVMSKEGVEMFGKATQYPVLRIDASNEWAPEFVRPKKEKDYLDTQAWEYITQTEDQLQIVRRKLFPK